MQDGLHFKTIADKDITGIRTIQFDSDQYRKDWHTTLKKLYEDIVSSGADAVMLVDTHPLGNEKMIGLKPINAVFVPSMVMLIVARHLGQQFCMIIDPADCGQPGTTVTLVRLFVDVLLANSRSWNVQRMMEDFMHW